MCKEMGLVNGNGEWGYLKEFSQNTKTSMTEDFL